MRFSTTELVDLESRISNAAASALDRELAIFDKLRASILEQEGVIKQVSAAIAVLDVSTSLAELAQKRDWTRPEVDHSLAFTIKAGRHVVVEAALAKKGEPYVANFCDLTGEPGKGGQIAVITGPNMAGKSTYLRQNALIAILAQMGSFVPAEKAHIGVIDRLFSRVGAADDLARGRSTFMVEMVETAAIVNQATERSLVILDEIGRGTATFDGLSIAWAVMEHLHDKNRSRALFATHFHELTELARRLPRVMNLTVKVKDWQGDVIFLHEIVAGTADRSYGIQVAKLAGLPHAVISRAKVLLDEFEGANQKARSERAVADLPLFSVPEEGKPAPHRLELALGDLDIDSLSPKQALEALYTLKNLCL
jgi:DNA mismatch repair protein MutS